MEIVIRHIDGSVTYPNASHHYLDPTNGVLLVIVDGDTIHFSPHYWQQFVVDPKSDDPLNLDFGV